MSDLERWYRRLLRAYPAGYRADMSGRAGQSRHSSNRTRSKTVAVRAVGQGQGSYSGMTPLV